MNTFHMLLSSYKFFSEGSSHTRVDKQAHLCSPFHCDFFKGKIYYPAVNQILR